MTAATSMASPVREALDAAHALLAEPPGAHAWTLASAELGTAVRDVVALRAQLDALLHDLVRQADRRGLPAEVGAKTTARWLRSVARLADGAARDLVHLAMSTDPDAAPGGESCPVTGAALRAGDLDSDQALVVTKAMAALPRQVDSVDPALRVEAETYLVEQAATLNPRDLGVVARALHEAIVQHVGALDVDDPNEAERLAREADVSAYRRRGVRLRQHSPGLSRVAMILPDDVATGLMSALDALVPPIADPDPVAPSDEALPDGDGVTDSGSSGTSRKGESWYDDRSPAQRRADAVAELVTLALDSARLPDRGGERPHVTLTVEWDLLRQTYGQAGFLDTGESLSAADVRRLLCDALVVPVVLGGDSQPLDVGRARRTFDRYQRRALLARDGGCAGLGCDPHAARTQAHHGVHWADGGPTDIRNAALLCDSWHRKVHLEGWAVRLGRNGHPELIPPAWIDPTRTPRQNHRFHQPPRGATGRTPPLRT
ncbi:MAG: HNH endonuclease [Actinomycetota bacterium]|nr:HNH endonuclease [Actinomycetota bacterium]